MNSRSAKSKFKAVLKAEKLIPIPLSFRDPSFFDEVPLYSRYKQVDFLEEYGEVDQLLLELSLDYLNNLVVEVPETKSQRFLALTIIRDDDSKYIVPYVFICNSYMKTRLRKLHLKSPRSKLGKYVQSLLGQIVDFPRYEAFDDRSTIEDDVRVFVGYRNPPDRLANLYNFINTT